MRIASIDIGTNTVLLLIADIDEHGVIHPVEHQQRLPRLGRDVGQNKVIHTTAFDRIAWILNEYRNLAQQLRAEETVACATSAVRDAANRDEFQSYMKSATGIDVEALSGDEEALLTYRGAISGFPNLKHEAVVLDIGGGSTEITYPSKPTPPLLSGEGRGEVSLTRHSLQLGSVRLTERYFKHDPPTVSELQSAVDDIRKTFADVSTPQFSQYRLIGVAGTVTTLACLDQQLLQFDIEKVSGYEMSRHAVAAWQSKLSSMHSQHVRSLSSTTEGRADILAAGVLILHEFMEYFDIHSVLVSERGLRYGLAIREWENRR